MTNYEWLLNMSGEERQAWFDAQHVEANGALSAENDVSAGGMDANDANVAQDSREKLEADASELTADYAASGDVCDALYGGIIGLLDRQAAITRREVLTQPDERDEQLAELTAQLYELTAECDALTAECDALADDLRDCNRERESLRGALGVAIDHAHDILQLIDEGMA